MKNEVPTSFKSIVLPDLKILAGKFSPTSFLLIFGILSIAFVANHIDAQPILSAADMPTTFETQALVRNGNTAFEGALFTPATPAPGEPGGEPWQMDPPGDPIWNTNGNFYGDVHTFFFNYVSSTGVTTWKIDFNRDGDYDDPEETVFSIAPGLVGLGFEYVNIIGQGAAGISVSVTNFVLNGVNFEAFTASATPFNKLFEETSGLFTNITASGSFSFSGNGGQDIPVLAVRLAYPNDPPQCEVTGPLTGAFFNVGDPMTITGIATDPDGIDVVEFYYGVTKIGFDSFPPYSLSWIDSIPGNLAITVRAIDHFGASTFSVAQMIFSNAAPVCTITNPVDGQLLYDPDLISFDVSATDITDNVASVEFFLNGLSQGVDNMPPYHNANLVNLPMGMYTLTAKATDIFGSMTLSAPVDITVRCIVEDIDNNGTVNTTDFLLFLLAYGAPCSGCPADFNFDGAVNTSDFLHLLTKMGHTCN